MLKTFGDNGHVTLFLMGKQTNKTYPYFDNSTIN